MHEITRLAYLDAMGIGTYVSRGQLPGAAPSRRLVLCPTAAGAAPVPPPVAAPPEMPAVGRTTARRPQAVEPARPAPDAAPIEHFSIATVSAGGRLWLEELGGAPLAREQVQMIQSMAHAMGWQKSSAEVQVFDWPTHTNQQLDLGPEAAHAALAGFLERRMEALACIGLVVLGSPCQARVVAAKPTGERLECSVTTAAMLADPGLKRRAWAELAPFVTR